MLYRAKGWNNWSWMSAEVKKRDERMLESNPPYRTSDELERALAKTGAEVEEEDNKNAWLQKQF
uniref:Uncharacterized protein n=1 Tax=Melanopsichium pennsylvanicum 4 TaxID=1398559 RepID=A0A077QXS7_9BASI|nr:uncharacterized protein BN887_06013 [Melanopsichium pennsylvanicum 4]